MGISRTRQLASLFFVTAAACLPACSDDEAPANGGTGGSAGGAGGATGGGGQGGSTGGAPPISDLSDDFEGTDLDPAWTAFGAELVELAIEDGQLAITMTDQALWFQSSTAFLLHRRVAGDFKATAVVRARRASDPTSPADGFIHLGGVMARAPEAPSGEDYVFVVVGRDEQDLSVETKTTDDGVSTYDGPAWPSGDAELRLCRVGADFILLKRAVGDATWVEADEFAREDLPNELDVGINVYSGSAPDLLVLVDSIDYAPVESATDCTTD